jgi:hypothetical protein
MNFNLDTNVGGNRTRYACPPGQGRGTLAYDRLMFWPANDGGYTSGAYTFSCPDAGIAVYGCFAYKLTASSFLDLEVCPPSAVPRLGGVRSV